MRPASVTTWRHGTNVDEWVHGFLPGCRRHGRGCRVLWGYDQDHTDSDRPYTLDELAVRKDGPHRYAYPTDEAYKEGWHLWLALRRDARLSRAESDVIFNMGLDRMVARAAAMGRDLSLVADEFRR